MSTEKMPQSVELPQIPEEIKAYWQLISDSKESNTEVLSHTDWLAGMTKSLAKKDENFAEIFSKYENPTAKDMQDALEEYSKILTEPKK